MYIPELGAQISLVEVKQVLKIIKAGKAKMKSCSSLGETA